jgi:hypothetical protein
MIHFLTQRVPLDCFAFNEAIEELRDDNGIIRYTIYTWAPPGTPSSQLASYDRIVASSGPTAWGGEALSVAFTLAPTRFEKTEVFVARISFDHWGRFTAIEWRRRVIADAVIYGFYQSW